MEEALCANPISRFINNRNNTASIAAEEIYLY